VLLAIPVTYVAPEVVLNKGEDPATREGYNKKADVWSLGVILYILCVVARANRRARTRRAGRLNAFLPVSGPCRGRPG